MVGGFEIAISPPVAETVDHTGREKRNPRHLNQPHHKSPHTEEEKIRDEGEGRSKQAEWLVDATFDDVVRGALSVLFDEGLIVSRGVIERGAVEHDAPDPVDDRAVRILVGIDVSVMVTVHRHPLARWHRSPHPEPESHEVLHYRVEGDTAMRLTPMQI